VICAVTVLPLQNNAYGIRICVTIVLPVYVTKYVCSNREHRIWIKDLDSKDVKLNSYYRDVPQDLGLVAWPRKTRPARPRPVAEPLAEQRTVTSAN
jgi:hypothetical protein